ncbi:MAG: pilus assembly protein [Lachnospiraceae bacterium]|nr:pilus assembly protein [Lachnospiraceae bacterium]
MREITEKKNRETKQNLCRDEHGMMAVEATLTLTLFLLMVAFIVNLINVLTVHNRIQYALNAAAHELSAVSYASLIVQKGKRQVHGDFDPYAKPIADTGSQFFDAAEKISNVAVQMQAFADDVQNFGYDGSPGGMYGDFQQIGNDFDSLLESGEEAYDSSATFLEMGGNLISDPHSTMVGLIGMAISGGLYGLDQLAGKGLAYALTGSFLGLESTGFEKIDNADAWLRRYGVKNGYKGIDFSGSIVFQDGGPEIVFCATYEIDVKTFLPVSPKPTICVSNRAVAAGWLDGDQACLSDYR